MVLVSTEAPARMNMIMHETRVEPIRLPKKFSQVRLRLQPAIASEPSTPQAAHLVAVAQPAISTQTMRMMSSVQGMRLPEARIFSLKVISGSPGGTLSGWVLDHQAM